MKIAGAAPDGGQHLPANLKAEDRFAGAVRHRYQNPVPAFKDDRTVHGGLLAIAFAFVGDVIGRREKLRRVAVVRKVILFAVARP